MQELRDVAAGDRIVGFIADPPYQLTVEFVQGVNLLLDPFWLRYHRANYGYYTDESPASGSYRTHKAINGHRLDFAWRPSGWSEHCRAMGYPRNAHPVSIQVLLRAAPTPSFLAEAPRDVEGHPVLYEERDPCVAFSGQGLYPGSKVGRVGPAGGMLTEGTLGGFLRDSRTAERYAVSCAHVLGPVGSQISTSPRTPPVAEVCFAVAPAASSHTTKCNRVAQAAVLDLAIAEVMSEISASVALGKEGSVHHVTPVADITSDDPVMFRHAHEAKLVPAKVGPLNIWREVMIGSQSYCMGDMMIIQPRRRAYVRTSLSGGGDSGAWVFSSDNSLLAWDGMIIAGDGPDVYCSFAEQIVDKCLEHNSSLVLAA